jgi:hypothetical protein
MNKNVLHNFVSDPEQILRKVRPKAQAKANGLCLGRFNHCAKLNTHVRSNGEHDPLRLLCTDHSKHLYWVGYRCGRQSF